MMKQSPSNNAIIYAILALNSEIEFQKDYLASNEIPTSEERELEEETLDDLEQAFMEFVDIYKLRCKADKQLPSIDELLNSDW
jgi:hypothetical protein